jgi:hypothetical protein
MTHAQLIAIAAALGAAFTIVGCEKKPESPSTPSTPVTTSGDDHDGHDHAPGDGHDHHHGPTVALGESAIGTFQCVVTRDEGPIAAGGDAAIDATITGGGPIAAVRFWIGTADAKGSIKAKAEIENPAEPNRWHTHAEIPDPMPAGAMLWVEIETATGEKLAGSFDLRG